MQTMQINETICVNLRGYEKLVAGGSWKNNKLKRYM